MAGILADRPPPAPGPREGALARPPGHRLAAPEAARLDDTALGLHERAGARVLDEPLGAAHSRGAVLTGRAEAAFAVPPEEALAGLLALGARSGPLAARARAQTDVFRELQ